MRLDAVLDQPRAVEQLGRALSTGRVAHAYAFVGPVGSGRFTTALAFAAALLCERGGCGDCRTCAAVDERRHPDLHVLAPSPPESNPRGARAIRIGAIRELERQAILRPAQAARRVLIVDEADRMTGESPQAFLKFLEEPPPATVVILVLGRVRAVPATVISRCQLVRFRARGEGAVAAAVAEALACVQEARAEGAPALFRRTERMDRERAETVVDGCWWLCRDLLLTRGGAPARLLTDPGRADVLAEEGSSWTDDALYTAIGACREARAALAGNVTPRLTLDVLLGRLATRGV